MDKNINMKANAGPSGNEEVKGADVEGGAKGNNYYPDFLKKAAHPGI